MRRGAAVIALLFVGSRAAPAWGQAVDGRVSLTAGATYNQTITDAPYPNAITFSGPSLSISPSGTLLVDSPRTTNTFQYTLALNLPFTRSLRLSSGPLSYNNRFTYNGRYQLSELTTATLGLTFSHAPLRTMTMATDATETPVDPIPTAASYMLQVTANQGLSRQLSESWTLAEMSSVAVSNPIDPVLVQSTTVAVQSSFTLTNQRPRDTIGVQLSLSSNYFGPAQMATGAVTDPRVQITDGLSLTYNRTLTEPLSLAITAGFTQVWSPPNNPAQAGQSITAVQPTGTLTLNYRLDPVLVTASYAHSALPNLATSSVNFTDAATLRFSVPLSDTGVILTGSGGYTHMEPLGSTTASATNVLMADTSLQWRPPLWSTVSVSVRGQVQRQMGGDQNLGDFTRWSGTLNLTYSYPSTTAAGVRPNMPPALGVIPSLPSDINESNRPFEPGLDEPAPAPPPAAPKR